MLNLRPVTPADRGALCVLLDQRHLRRRPLATAFCELHPLLWTQGNRSFAIEREGDLLGAVELIRDSDDPTAWECTVLMGEVHEPGDGSRCAAAALFYLFEHLEAESAWFWVRREHTPGRHLAERFHFTRLHAITVAGDVAADVYELESSRWPQVLGEVAPRHLRKAITIHDGIHAWRGDVMGFHPLEHRPPRPSAPPRL